ncbi:MAG: hypothetical protein N3A66_04875, partial [Planctomycetota bacterium]|nr:hypothetical protein [Planctomycetota bacterium]
ADDCRAFLHGEVLQARPVPPYRRLLRHAARHRFSPALAACVVILASALLIYFAISQRKIAQKDAAVKQVSKTLEVIKEKAEKSDRELQRDWRQEFALGFERGWTPAPNCELAHKTRQAWFDRRLAQTLAQEDGLLAVESDPAEPRDKSPLPTRGAFGIPLVVPTDFSFALRVRLPAESPGALVVFIGADREFRRREMTQTIALAATAPGGAKLWRGEAILASEPNFGMNAGVWHRVEIVRYSGTLRVQVDGKEILRNTEAIPPRETEAAFFAVASQNGALHLDDVSLAVLGMSPAMVKSLSEMAANLVMVRDYPLAFTLYERVARESTDPPLHLAALRGYARCLAALRTNRVAMIEDCQQLVQKMRLARPVAPDEENYLYGLALAESKNQADLTAALNYFEIAMRAAMPSQDDLFTPQALWIIGPFPAISDEPLRHPYPPEIEFQTEREYPGKAGTVRWTRLDAVANDGQIIQLAGDAAQKENAIFYVRRVFQSRQALPVLIETGSDDGLAMWVNGRRILEKDVARAALPASEISETTFQEGENIILLKIRNQKGGAAFSLRVIPSRVPALRLGIYGLLARLEAALIFLKTGDIKGVKERLAAMQRDGTLEALGQPAYAEHLRLGGPLAYVLEQIDRMLNKAEDLETPWCLLDAMQTVYPQSAKDLATRYHRLGNLFRDKDKAAEAAAAYQKAIMLLPRGFLPYF